MKNISFKEIWLAVLLYAVVAFLFLWPAFFSGGAVAGGDWSMPLDRIQAMVNFKSSLNTWIDRGNVFGERQAFLTSFLPQLYFLGLAVLGISGIAASKILLFLAFVFPATALFFLCRYLGTKTVSAFIAGFILISSALFFDYALMGWVFVLFVIGLFAISVALLLEAFAKRSIPLAIWTGLVFSLGMLQSQAVVWFPLIFLGFAYIGVPSRREAWDRTKTLAIVFLVFLLVNLFWWPSLLFVKDQELASHNVLQSAVSVGAGLRLTFGNLLRSWGSLFNYQYETESPPILQMLSFILPILAFLAIFIKSKRNIILPFLFLVFIPLLFYSIDRSILTRLPLSGLIRDIGRFNVLSLFAMAVLSAFTIDRVFEFKPSLKRFTLAIIVLASLAISAPFWNLGLFSKPVADFDIRLRLKEYPADYYAAEKYLADTREPGEKTLYLPLGGFFSLSDDLRFNGSFREIRDTFAEFSPSSGSYGYTDKRSFTTDIFAQVIKEKLEDGNPSVFDQIRLAGIDTMVLRHDAEFKDKKKVVKFLNESVESGLLEKEFSTPAVEIFSFTKPADPAYLPGRLFLLSDSVEMAGISPDLADLNSTKSIGSYNLSSRKRNISNFYSIMSGQSQAGFVFNQPGYADSHFVTFVDSQALHSLIDQTMFNNEALLAKKFQIDPGKVDLDILNYQLRIASEKEQEAGYLAQIKEGGPHVLYFIAEEAPLPAATETVMINGSRQILNLTLLPGGRFYRSDTTLAEGVLRLESERTPAGAILATDLVVSRSAATLVSQKRVSPWQHEIVLGKADADQPLILSESYNSNWTLYALQDGRKVAVPAAHFAANNYANGWIVPAGFLTGEQNNFMIEFTPQKILDYGIILSLLSLALSLGAAFYLKRREK